MGDEQYYLIVEQELKDEKIDKALWAKASALAKGNDVETRLQYTQLRLEALEDEASRIQKTEHVKKAKVQVKKYSIIIGKIVIGLVGLAFLINAYIEW